MLRGHSGTLAGARSGEKLEEEFVHAVGLFEL
jgi:hypothetical protein